jgi:hypothetical protein
MEAPCSLVSHWEKRATTLLGVAGGFYGRSYVACAKNETPSFKPKCVTLHQTRQQPTETEHIFAKLYMPDGSL